MLCRCKGKNAAKYIRRIAISATPSNVFDKYPKGKPRELIEKEDEESWNKVLKSTPTTTSTRTLNTQRRQKPFDSNFSLSRKLGQSRNYSTGAKPGGRMEGSERSPDDSESIFDSQESGWDHVFDGVEYMPPTPQPRPRSTYNTSAGLSNPRRQAMTAREIDIFQNMFDMIFDAAKKQKPDGGVSLGIATGRPRTAADRRADKSARRDPLSGVGIGSGPQGSGSISDLFGRLKRVSRSHSWSQKDDAELDRKLAQLEMCETDLVLLEWAAREVFDEATHYEEAAQQALLQREAQMRPSLNRNPESAKTPLESTESTASDAESYPEESQGSAANDETSSPDSPSTSPLPLQPPFYPDVLAALIRNFRVKFHDPHLALSIFEHARTRSIASYVFGCTVQVYNELIRTRWDAFHDLRGVADALEEMRVNGIVPDARTRLIVEEIRRTVGERTLWQEERDIGTGEVLELLTQIDNLTHEPLKKLAEEGEYDPKRQAQTRSGRRTWSATDEQWKYGDEGSDSNYKFGDWSIPDDDGEYPLRRNRRSWSFQSNRQSFS